MKQQTSTILRRCLRKEMEKAASAAEYYPNRHIQIEQARRQGVRPDLIAAHERWLKRKAPRGTAIPTERSIRSMCSLTTTERKVKESQ